MVTGERHREVAPPVQRQRGGAVDALLAAGAAGGEGEAGVAVRVAGGQVEVAGGVVAEVEDAGPVGVVRGLHPGGEGEGGRVAEDAGGQVDVLVGSRARSRRRAEPPRDAEHGRIAAQRLTHLGQGADHVADLVGVGRLPGAPVCLGEHGEEVTRVVAAEVSVRLAVETLPAAGSDRVTGGEPGVGAEDLQQPVDVVATAVIEHQVALGGEDSVAAESHVLEREGPHFPGGRAGGATPAPPPGAARGGVRGAAVAGAPGRDNTSGTAATSLAPRRKRRRSMGGMNSSFRPRYRTWSDWSIGP